MTQNNICSAICHTLAILNNHFDSCMYMNECIHNHIYTYQYLYSCYVIYTMTQNFITITLSQFSDHRQESANDSPKLGLTLTDLKMDWFCQKCFNLRQLTLLWVIHSTLNNGTQKQKQFGALFSNLSHFHASECEWGCQKSMSSITWYK